MPKLKNAAKLLLFSDIRKYNLKKITLSLIKRTYARARKVIFYHF